MADLLDDLKAIGDVSAVLLKAANEIRGLRAAAREKDINLCFERAVRTTAEHQLAQANAKIEGLEAVRAADDLAFLVLWRAPELNMANYDEDQVTELNQAVIEAVVGMKAVRPGGVQEPGT